MKKKTKFFMFVEYARTEKKKKGDSKKRKGRKKIVSDEDRWDKLYLSILELRDRQAETDEQIRGLKKMQEESVKQIMELRERQEEATKQIAVAEITFGRGAYKYAYRKGGVVLKVSEDAFDILEPKKLKIFRL